MSIHNLLSFADNRSDTTASREKRGERGGDRHPGLPPPGVPFGAGIACLSHQHTTGLAPLAPWNRHDGILCLQHWHRDASIIPFPRASDKPLSSPFVAPQPFKPAHTAAQTRESLADPGQACYGSPGVRSVTLCVIGAAARSMALTGQYFVSLSSIARSITSCPRATPAIRCST